MKIKYLYVIILLLLMTSCASIPQSSIALSNKIGDDLKVLHISHRNSVQLYYRDIKSNVNTLIDDVYAPFIIQHVLESELTKHKNGESSIYGIIELAGKNGGKNETEEALNVMLEFQEAVNIQVAGKRAELLSPIVNQEMEILNTIDQSYQNTIYANTTLTAYITSIYKIKESQKEALSIVGLKGLDIAVTDKLVKLSESIGDAVKKGKDIDAKSDNALEEIETLMTEIKEFTNK